MFGMSDNNARGRVFVRFYGEMGGPNSTKRCTKLAEIPQGNLTLLSFRLFHRLKMAAVFVTSLLQILRSVILSIYILTTMKIQ